MSILLIVLLAIEICLTTSLLIFGIYYLHWKQQQNKKQDNIWKTVFSYIGKQEKEFQKISQLVENKKPEYKEQLTLLEQRQEEEILIRSEERKKLTALLEQYIKISEAQGIQLVDSIESLEEKVKSSGRRQREQIEEQTELYKEAVAQMNSSMEYITEAYQKLQQAILDIQEEYKQISEQDWKEIERLITDDKRT